MDSENSCSIIMTRKSNDLGSDAEASLEQFSTKKPPR